MRIRPGACVWCGHTLDATLETGPAARRAAFYGSGNEPEVKPTVGDMTICIECAGPMVFGPGLIFVKPTLPELNALAENPNVRLAMGSVIMLRFLEKAARQ